MPNILIIDDYDILREVMQLALEDEYTVFTARSGEEALGLLELVEPDVVITDLEMPGMSGMELIKRINIVGVDLCVDPTKQLQYDSYVNPQGEHIGPPIQCVCPKIILYTAMLTPSLVANAKSLGVAACLPKPFELGELKRRIKELLDTEITN